MRHTLLLAGSAVLLPYLVLAQRPPIIDVHLHAQPATNRGPACAQPESLPLIFSLTAGMTDCAHPLRPASTGRQLMEQTLELLEEWNITAVTSGAPTVVDLWRQAGGRRIIPALSFQLPNVPSVATLRDWFTTGRFAVLGEVGNQYAGIAPDDPRFEPYLALAERLDIPIAYHMGPGPPGAPYLGAKQYRARLSNPFLLEEVLVRHPKLRFYVMHAAQPLADNMVAMMFAHPQLHVDTGVISWAMPRAEFYRHLRRLVEAGLGKRILFGSDQMQWPDAIPVAIQAIEGAPFLTAEQKRDILFHNAERFLRVGVTKPSAAKR